MIRSDSQIGCQFERHVAVLANFNAPRNINMSEIKFGTIHTFPSVSHSKNSNFVKFLQIFTIKCFCK